MGTCTARQLQRIHSLNFNTIMQKSVFFALFSICFLALIQAAPSVMLNSDQTDDDRFAYMMCLKRSCKNHCSKTQWKLFESKACDFCARKKCQEFTYKNEKFLHGYGYTEWMAYNQFVDKMLEENTMVQPDSSDLGIE